MKRSFMINDLLAPEPPMKKKKQYFLKQWIDKIQTGAGQSKKGNSNNKVLDEKQFNGKHHNCLSAGQAATGQYTGWFFPPQFSCLKKAKKE
jgi:hypothetical protein